LPNKDFIVQGIPARQYPDGANLARKVGRDIRETGQAGNGSFLDTEKPGWLSGVFFEILNMAS